MSFAGLTFLPRLGVSGARALGQPAFRRSFTRFASSAPSPRAICISRSLHSAKPNLGLYSIGLGLSFLTYQSLSTRSPVICEAPFSAPQNAAARSPNAGNDAPESILSLYQLSFGAVCGICSGVFLKKGLRAIAFLLGGVFVLLQYMSSKSYISVDWARLSSRYDSAFGTRTSAGGSRAPTVGGVWQGFVDFLTANFQQRASFLAGFVLGLRLG